MHIEIFISYAWEDEAHLKALERHLSMLKRQGILNAWHAELVGAGQDWGKEVEKRLASARMIILLVSSRYIFSDVTYDQMEHAIERARDGNATVIPVLVSPYSLQGSRVDKLARLPSDRRAVTDWRDDEAAWANVAAGIRQRIVDLNGGKTISPVTGYSRVSSPPSSGGYAPPSSGRSPLPSDPASWAAPVVQVSSPGFSAPTSTPSYPTHGARTPQSSRAQSTRSFASPGGRSWLWRGAGLAILAACSFIGWSAFRSPPSGTSGPVFPPAPGGIAAVQASVVSLDWGPGSSACPTLTPQIILGDCRQFKDLEWLRGELRTLQRKRIGCLPDLPAGFTLQSGDDAATGIKNFYLFIFDATGTQRVGNVWIKGGKLTVTDLNTRKKVVLAYDTSGSWSAGPDPDHLKLVP